MNAREISAALYAAVAAITPTLALAYPNAPFSPVAGTPYVRVDVIWARPDNGVYGDQYREQGALQVVLCYPIDAGVGPALDRADKVRSTFRRGVRIEAGDGHVLILATPALYPALVDGDRFCVPLRISWCADVFQ